MKKEAVTLSLGKEEYKVETISDNGEAKVIFKLWDETFFSYAFVDVSMSLIKNLTV